MFVVTGGAGFIGSAIVHALSSAGYDVVVVDHDDDQAKLDNLSGAAIVDLLSPRQFLESAAGADDTWSSATIIHQGAISSTMHPDEGELMAANFGYSSELLAICLRRRLPLVYASSASTYGRSQDFAERPENEAPLNAYARSKLLFDQLVRRALPEATSPVVGLRYFNVYGPREGHKHTMASMVHRLDAQMREQGTARLFGASHGCGPGEQRRDFVHVDDVVGVVQWFLGDAAPSGIFNCGTGQCWSFNELATELRRFHPGASISYVDMPDRIAAAYQDRTQADLTALRAAGYDREFVPLAAGVRRFVEATSTQPAVT